MLTRQYVKHQYGQHPANASPPPFHVYMHEHQYPEPSSRARLQGAGGLIGGHVTLAAGAVTGMRIGNTGYGYLGLDPSDPATWITRKFQPTAGMISYLNYGA